MVQNNNPLRAVEQTDGDTSQQPGGDAAVREVQTTDDAISERSRQIAQNIAVMIDLLTGNRLTSSNFPEPVGHVTHSVSDALRRRLTQVFASGPRSRIDDEGASFEVVSSDTMTRIVAGDKQSHTTVLHNPTDDSLIFCSSDVNLGDQVVLASPQRVLPGGPDAQTHSANDGAEATNLSYQVVQFVRKLIGGGTVDFTHGRTPSSLQIDGTDITDRAQCEQAYEMISAVVSRIGSSFSFPIVMPPMTPPRADTGTMTASADISAATSTDTGTVQAFPLFAALAIGHVDAPAAHEYPPAIADFLNNQPGSDRQGAGRAAVEILRAARGEDAAGEQARSTIDALLAQSLTSGPAGERARQLLNEMAAFAAGTGDGPMQARQQLELLAQRAGGEGRNAVLSALMRALTNSPNAPGAHDMVLSMGRIAQQMGQELHIEPDDVDRVRLIRSLRAVSNAVLSQEGNPPPLGQAAADMLIQLATQGSETMRPLASATLSGGTWENHTNLIETNLRQRFLTPPSADGLRSLIGFAAEHESFIPVADGIIRQTLNDNRPFDLDRNAADYNARRDLYFAAFQSILDRNTQNDSALNDDLLRSLRGNFNGDNQAFLRQLLPDLPQGLGARMARLILNAVPGEQVDEGQQPVMPGLLNDYRRFVTPEAVRNFRTTFESDSGGDEQRVTGVMLNLLDSPARAQAAAFLSNLSARQSEYDPAMITRAGELANNGNAEIAAAATAFLARAAHLTYSAEQSTQIQQRLTELGRTPEGLARLVAVASSGERGSTVASSVLQTIAGASAAERSRVVQALLAEAGASATTEPRRTAIGGLLQTMMAAEEGGTATRELLTAERNNNQHGQFARSLLDNPAPPSVANTEGGRFISEIAAVYNDGEHRWNRNQDPINFEYLALVAATGQIRHMGVERAEATTDAQRQQFSAMAFQALQRIAEEPRYRSALLQAMTQAYLANPNAAHSRQLLESILQGYAPNGTTGDALQAIQNSGHSDADSVRLLRAIAGGATGRQEVTAAAATSYSGLRTALLASLDHSLAAPTSAVPRNDGAEVTRLLELLRQMPDSGVIAHLQQVMRNNAPDEWGEQDTVADRRFSRSLNALLQSGGPTSGHAEFANHIVDSLDRPMLDQLQLRAATLNPETGAAIAQAMLNRLRQPADLSYEERQNLLIGLQRMRGFVTAADVNALRGLDLQVDPASGTGDTPYQTLQEQRANVQSELHRLTVALMLNSNSDIRSAALDLASSLPYSAEFHRLIASARVTRPGTGRGTGQPAQYDYALSTLLDNNSTRERTLDLLTRMWSSGEGWLRYAASDNDTNLQYIARAALRETGGSTAERSLTALAGTSPEQRQRVMRAMMDALRSTENAHPESAQQLAADLAWFAVNDTTGATRTWLRQQLAQPGSERALSAMARVTMENYQQPVRNEAQALILQVASAGQLPDAAWTALVRAYQGGYREPGGPDMRFLAAVAGRQAEIPAGQPTYEQQLQTLSGQARDGNQRSVDLIMLAAAGHDERHRQAAVIVQQLAENGNQQRRDELVRAALNIADGRYGLSYMHRAVANIILGRFSDPPASHQTAVDRMAEAIRAIPRWPGDRSVFNPMVSAMADYGYSSWSGIHNAILETLPQIPRTAQERDQLFRSLIDRFQSQENNTNLLPAIIAMGNGESPQLSTANRDQARALVAAALDRLTREGASGTDAQVTERVSAMVNVLNALMTQHRPTWYAPGNPLAAPLANGSVRDNQAFLAAAPVMARLLQNPDSPMSIADVQALSRLAGNSTDNRSTLNAHIDRLLLRGISTGSTTEPAVQRAIMEYFQRHGFTIQNSSGSEILRAYIARISEINPQESVALANNNWDATMASIRAGSGPISLDNLRNLTRIALGSPNAPAGDAAALVQSLRTAATAGNNRALEVLMHAAGRIRQSSSSAADRTLGQQLQAALVQIAGNTNSDRARVLTVASSLQPLGSTTGSYLDTTLTALRRQHRDVLPQAPAPPPAGSETAPENLLTTTTDTLGRRVVTESTASGVRLQTTTYDATNPSLVVSRTVYTYLDNERRLTYAPGTDATVSASTSDATGRVTQRLIYPNLQALEQNRPTLRETITYSADAAAHTQTQTRQLINISNPSQPVPAGTVVRVYNTQSGETTVTSTSTVRTGNQNMPVQQTARYDWAGTLVALQRQEGSNRIDYTLRTAGSQTGGGGGDQSSPITGATLNGAAITNAAQLNAIVQIGRQTATTLRLQEQIASIDSPLEILPTQTRQGSTPTGVLVWGERNGLDWQYHQARVENGRILGPNGAQLGTVADNGQVVLTSGRTFNILHDEAAAFHGIGSDGMRLDIVPQSRATALTGSLSSPDGQRRMVIVGGNLYNSAGSFVGRIDREGNITGPDTDGRTVHINSQFEGWSLRGQEGENLRVVPSLSSASPSGRFFWTPPGGSNTEYIVQMGAVIDRTTGQQVGLMTAPAMDGYRYLSGGTVTFFNGDAPPRTMSLEDMRNGAFDLHLPAATGTQPLRLQFVSLGEPSRDSGNPYFGRLLSLSAGRSLFERDVARQQAAGQNPYQARGNIDDLNRFFQDAMQSGYVHQQTLNDLLRRISMAEGSALRTDFQHRMHRISMSMRDVEPLPTNLTTLNGTVRVPTFNSAGAQQGAVASWRITQGNIFNAEGVQIGRISSTSGALTNVAGNGPLQHGGRAFTNMAQIEGAVWRLTGSGFSGPNTNFSRISTGGSVVSWMQLRAAGNGVVDYYSAAANAGGSTAATNNLAAARTRNTSYAAQLEQAMQNGFTNRRNMFELLSAWRNVAPPDSSRPTPPSIQPPTLTADSSRTINGRLRIGNEFFTIRDGQLFAINEQGVTATQAAGRLGANYQIQWEGGTRPPLNLAERSRVIMEFTMGGSTNQYHLLGVGQPRMTSLGMMAGGLIDERELSRQVREAHQAAVQGNVQYFRDRPWITGGFTNWIANDPERVMRNLLSTIGQNRGTFNDRLSSLFTDGFNRTFSNSDVDSRLGLVELYQHTISSTAQDSQQLTQMVTGLQRQVQESAAMAAITLATMGVGSAFAAGRTALQVRNIAATGIRVAPQVLARGIQEGLYLTRFQRVAMLGGELATASGAGGLTSVVMRGSDGADHWRNFFSGTIEGGTMSAGHHLQALSQGWNLLGRSLMAGGNALFQSTAFAGAGSIRENSAEHFDLAHIGLGTATMLLARPFAVIGGGSPWLRGITEGLAFGGFSGVEPGLNAERQRIEQQLGLPAGSLSVTSSTFWTNVNYTNLRNSIVESAAFSALPIAVATAPRSLARGEVAPQLVRSRQVPGAPVETSGRNYPHELTASHSDAALARAFIRLGQLTRAFTGDLAPHQEAINRYRTAQTELTGALQAEATRTGTPMTELQARLARGEGPAALQQMHDGLMQQLTNPHVQEFQTRVQALQTAVAELARQNGVPPLQVEISDATAGGSAYRTGQNRMIISASDLFSSAGGTNLFNALQARGIQQSQDVLVVRAIVEDLRRTGVDVSTPELLRQRLQETFRQRTGSPLDAGFADAVLALHQNSRPLTFAEVARANLLAANMASMRTILGEAASTPNGAHMIDVLSRLTESDRHSAVTYTLSYMNNERLTALLQGVNAVGNPAQSARFFRELGGLSGAERANVLNAIAGLPTPPERAAAITAMLTGTPAHIADRMRYVASLPVAERAAALRDFGDATRRPIIDQAVAAYRAAHPPEAPATTAPTTPPTPAPPAARPAAVTISGADLAAQQEALIRDIQAIVPMAQRGFVAGAIGHESRISQMISGHPELMARHAEYLRHRQQIRETFNWALEQATPSGRLSGSARDMQAWFGRLSVEQQTMFAHAIQSAEPRAAAEAVVALSSMSATQRTAVVPMLATLEPPARVALLRNLGSLSSADLAAALTDAGSRPTAREQALRLQHTADHPARLSEHLAAVPALDAAARQSINASVEGSPRAAERLRRMTPSELEDISRMTPAERQRLVQLFEQTGLSVEAYRLLSRNAPDVLRTAVDQRTRDNVAQLARTLFEQYTTPGGRLLAARALNAVPAEHMPRVLDAINRVPAEVRRNVLESFLRMDTPNRVTLSERLAAIPPAERSAALEWITRMPHAAEFLTAVRGVSEQYRAHAFQTMWLGNSFREVLAAVPEAQRSAVLENFSRLPLHQQNALAGVADQGTLPVAARAELLSALTTQPGNNPLTAALSYLGNGAHQTQAFNMLAALTAEQRAQMSSALATTNDPARQAGALRSLANLHASAGNAEAGLRMITNMLSDTAGLRSLVSSATPTSGPSLEVASRAPIDWRLHQMLQSRPPEGMDTAAWQEHVERRALDVIREHARSQNWYGQMFGAENAALAELAVRVAFTNMLQRSGEFRNGNPPSIDLNPAGRSPSQTFRHEMRHFADAVDLAAIQRVDPAAYRATVLDQLCRELGRGNPRADGPQVQLTNAGRTLMERALRDLVAAQGNIDRVLQNPDGTFNESYRPLLNEFGATDAAGALRRALTNEYHLFERAAAPALETPAGSLAEQMVANRARHYRTLIEQHGSLAGLPGFEQMTRGLLGSAVGRSDPATYSFGSQEEFAARRSALAQAQRNLLEHLRGLGLEGEPLQQALVSQGGYITELIRQENAIERLQRELPADQRRPYLEAMQRNILERSMMTRVVDLPPAMRQQLSQFLQQELARGTTLSASEQNAQRQRVSQELARLTEAHRLASLPADGGPRRDTRVESPNPNLRRYHSDGVSTDFYQLGGFFYPSWATTPLAHDLCLSPTKVHVTAENAAALRRVQEVLIRALETNPELISLVTGYKIMDPAIGMGPGDRALTGQEAKGFTVYTRNAQDARRVAEILDRLLADAGVTLPAAPNSGNAEQVIGTSNRVGLVRDTFVASGNQRTDIRIDDAVVQAMQTQNGGARLTEANLRALETQVGLSAGSLFYDARTGALSMHMNPTAEVATRLRAEIIAYMDSHGGASENERYPEALMQDAAEHFGLRRQRSISYDEDGALTMQLGTRSEPYHEGVYADESRSNRQFGRMNGRAAVYALYRHLGLEPATVAPPGTPLTEAQQQALRNLRLRR